MEKISNAVMLKTRISYLETERAGRELALKKELQLAHEALKPANLIKNTVKDLFSSDELKGSLLDGAMGMASGFLAKKAVTGSSKNPVKSILGGIVQAFVAGKVAENAEPIRTTVINAVKEFLNKKEEKPE